MDNSLPVFSSEFPHKNGRSRRIRSSHESCRCSWIMSILNWIVMCIRRKVSMVIIGMLWSSVRSGASVTIRWMTCSDRWKDIFQISIHDPSVTAHQFCIPSWYLIKTFRHSLLVHNRHYLIYRFLDMISRFSQFEIYHRVLSLSNW